MELWIDYQPAKFQCCRLSLASFIDRLVKHNDDVIMTSFHVIGIVKSQICETEYNHPSRFQISWLLGSNFMEVS